MKVSVLAAGVAVWIGLSFGLAKLMKLSGPDFWILAGGLSLLGIVAAIAIWWFLRPKSTAATPVRGGAAGTDDLGLLFREAESRLAKSQLGAGARLSTLPVFLLVGERGSAKTTVLVNSGLEPELIAGEVHRDNAIVSTDVANVWFARRSVFVEAGDRLLNDASGWNALVARLRPGRLLTVRETRQAPRAVLVCFDTETFFRPGGHEAAIGLARKLHARLGEISEKLGIQLPVYVLFTRADRISFFLEFVGNLTNDEASQVFGATLDTADNQAGSAVYSEKETARLGRAFDNLFVSLADKRPDYLIREHDESKLRGIYEFPREFNKLRNAVVQFLVELGRPSQLSLAPFLRGFYFTGVRPVVVNQNIQASARSDAEQHRFNAAPEATYIFSAPRFERPVVEPQPEMVQRRLPQWVFLSHLFPDVLLSDRAALAASGSSSRTSFARRAALGTAVAVCILFAAAFTVSFLKNRALEDRVLAAVRGIPSTEAAGNDLPSLDALTRLDNLRQSVATLSDYEANGIPLSLRAGLYTGSSLLPPTRRLYFQRFQQLLLRTTQQNLVTRLSALPASPGLADDYQNAYDTLKSYLITTSNHDKSTKAYLPPVLLNRWLAGRTIDPARLELARRQFEFYSEELKRENPFSSENDAAVVDHARRYLSKFAGAERVYQFMLAEANKTNRPINFNSQYPGSAQTVIDTYDVPGAFTRNGWTTMTDSLKHADRFFNGEQWVLGDQSSANLDPSSLQASLGTRYTSDFINHWRTYLKRATVVPYRSLADAAQKLRTLSGTESPLLQLFWLASQNTSANDPRMMAAFKPLHSVMPAGGGEQLILPANDAYMKALAALQINIDQVTQQPGTPNDAAAAQTLAAAQNAMLITRQMAQNFGRDPEFHLETVIEKLMEDPITSSQGLLRGLGPAELNSKGKGFCAQMSSVLTKFPFNPRSKVEATISDVNSAFQPKEGALWTFYDQNLSKYLIRQGAIYIPDPSTPVHLNGGFVSFFNRAAGFSQMAYPNGSIEPRFSYSVRPVFSEDIASLKLTIDGQTVNFTPGTGAKLFTWQASGPHGVQLSGKYRDGSDFQYAAYDGTWAVFEWVSDADAEQLSTLEWKLKAGNRDRPVLSPITNQPVVVRFSIDDPIFQRGYFSGLSCVSEIARP